MVSLFTDFFRILLNFTFIKLQMVQKLIPHKYIGTEFHHKLKKMPPIALSAHERELQGVHATSRFL